MPPASDKSAPPGMNNAVAPRSPPCQNHTFLFVNESSSSASQKIGRRRDIKSHVRYHIVERQKRNKKKDPASSSTEQGENKAERPTATTHVPLSEASGSRSSLAKPVGNSHIPEDGHDHDHDHDAQDLSLSNDQGILETKQNYIEHGALPRDYGTNSPESRNRQLADIQRSHEARCLVCGAVEDLEKLSLGGKAKVDDGFTTAARQSVRWHASRAKPVTFLGSGRIDPFSAYPSIVDDPNGSLHELMDHSVSYLLPGLLADGSSPEVSSLSKSWMAGALRSPLLFHALVFAGSIHLDFLRSNEIHPNAPVALSHKLAVIQQLNKALSDPTERLRDEIILAILILSSHEVMDLSGTKVSPFVSPLKSMQWLNVYGNIRNVQEHLKAVMDLVTLRGGVESLGLYGLAEVLIGGDIVAATTTLSPPSFLPLKRSDTWIANVLAWAKSTPRLPVISLGRAFSSYTTFGITPEMIDLFEAISAVTIGIEHYLKGEPRGLTLTAIARTRTVCQHRLLSLTPGADLVDMMGSRRANIYEAVRMTAFIYGIAVLWPIPRSYNVLLEIIQRQRITIENFDIEDATGEELHELLLWILTLGGIAALDKPEKNWYVERLGICTKRWGITNWATVENIMEKFLWLDSACGPGGRTLWWLVCEGRTGSGIPLGLDTSTIA